MLERKLCPKNPDDSRQRLMQTGNLCDRVNGLVEGFEALCGRYLEQALYVSAVVLHIERDGLVRHRDQDLSRKRPVSRELQVVESHQQQLQIPCPQLAPIRVVDPPHRLLPPVTPIPGVGHRAPEVHHLRKRRSRVPVPPRSALLVHRHRARVHAEERRHEVEVAARQHAPVQQPRVLPPIHASPGPEVIVEPVSADCEQVAVELDRLLSPPAARLHVALQHPPALDPARVAESLLSVVCRFASEVDERAAPKASPPAGMLKLCCCLRVVRLILGGFEFRKPGGHVSCDGGVSDNRDAVLKRCIL
mmetsp:Transcript_2682/g.6251  ORF Transcript_2682/g.6251 Transcript_2682/m.6251 type:complete len:305 (-) Transcript_2682:736-1650(-)